jgi:hypothetical protein
MGFLLTNSHKSHDICEKCSGKHMLARGAGRKELRRYLTMQSVDAIDAHHEVVYACSRASG